MLFVNIGRLLFKHTLRQAAALGASQVVIESDPNALDYYLKMGAYQVGTRSSMLERELPILNVEVKHGL